MGSLLDWFGKDTKLLWVIKSKCDCQESQKGFTMLTEHSNSIFLKCTQGKTNTNYMYLSIDYLLSLKTVRWEAALMSLWSIGVILRGREKAAMLGITKNKMKQKFV